MKNFSIAKFGSQLNLYFDKYSDKDLLVVAESYEQLNLLYDKYTKEGWSVSCYTYAKLKYLSKKGSLFLSHLKKDSEILIDYNNKFRKILSNHKTKDNYDYEIEDSKRYFNVIEEIPNLTLGYAWFCDCFYVGLRNLLIFENADKDIFEFSYLKLIELLLDDNRITEYEYSILRQLRVVKYNYREDVLDELPSRDFVELLVKIALKLNLIRDTKFQESSVFQNNLLNKIRNKEFNGYQRLRLIEGLYCSKEINIPEIKRIVSNPQFYASKLLDDKFVMKIINVLNGKIAYNYVNLITEIAQV